LSGSSSSLEAASDSRDVRPPGKPPFVLAALLLCGLLAFGAERRLAEHGAAVAVQRRTIDFVPTVRTFEARRLDKPIEITMPGETRPFDTARIYARATGYIAQRLVDFGTRVKKGDLMLRILAPQTDAQYDQAKAQLGQLQAQLLQSRADVDKAKANLALAKITSARISQLAGQGYATQQNADNNSTSVQAAQANLESTEAGVKVVEANIKAQQATVEGLQALVDFERVVAPFDGVVSQRTVDVGDLVHADAGSTPLLVVDRDDVLRASVNIPQTPAMGVRDGLPADVHIPQFPNQVFKGKVDRSSVNLLYSSRTLTTQVDIPNADRKLRAGLFVDITLAIPRTTPAVTVPAEALIFNQGGTHVAIVDRNGRIELRPVVIDRDLGATLDLKTGLEGGETVVLNPPADLKAGSRVRVPDVMRDSGS
jgi:HlyD family secretion protein